MLKREIKVNFKSFMIWTSILIGLFLVVFLIYPSIMERDTINALNEMMKMFPEEILKAFNMDISAIDSAFGWLKTEGFVFVLLITGIYSGILGSGILLKEESEKTIEYLNALPITRTSIVLNKVCAGVIYIVSMVFLLGIFNYIGLMLSGDFDQKVYLLLSVTPLFSSLVIFAFCLFVSTFAHKTKKTIGISLGIVFMSYFLNMISEISESVSFFKYFSVFSLADIRYVITESSINISLVIVSIVLFVMFIILTLINYHRKELV